MDSIKIELGHGIIIGLIVGVIVAFVLVILLPPIHKPTALDVYQGKTTLEITYKDSIPIDTIVVFKDEFKK